MQGRRANVRKRLLWILTAIMLVGCGSSGIRAPVEGRGTSAAPASRLYHTVAKGDTLYSIAWRYGLDYKDVAAWNRINAPYRIYPGERLRLTVRPKPRASTGRGAGRRVQSATGRPTVSGGGAAPSSGSASSAKEPHDGRRQATAKRAPSVKKSTSGAAKRVSWTWPAKGHLLRSFSQTGKKGVDIAGKLGQPVYAAGHGRVVYSGSGLLGYGKLIIVKHDKNYLSAYAHNHRILVSEGDEVARGQRIAQMGRTGADRVKLHFEIRRDGKPVDPLRYLPKT